MRHAQRVEQPVPVELAPVVALVEHPLRDVAGERDARALLARQLEEHPQLDGARVLHFVDEDVGEADAA